MIIGNIHNQVHIQGRINEAKGTLTGVISNAQLIGGQVVGMRGLKGDKGDKGDAGTTKYSDLTDKPQIEGVVLEGDKTFAQLNLTGLTNEDIEYILL